MLLISVPIVCGVKTLRHLKINDFQNKWNLK